VRGYFVMKVPAKVTAIERNCRLATMCGSLQMGSGQRASIGLVKKRKLWVRFLVLDAHEFAFLVFSHLGIEP